MANNETYLSEGLVHKIYQRETYILKIPKDEFEDFNNIKHFKIEAKSHEILSSNGIPAVKIANIYKKGSLIRGKNVLEEKYIEGEVKDNKDINTNERKEILKLMLKANKIKVEKFGNIQPDGRGIYQTWKSYLKYSLDDAKEVLSKNRNLNLKKTIKYLYDQIGIIKSIKQGYFVMSDTNSNNFIFDNSQRIKAALDVDHPISGDPLYDYAALKWHHPESYQLLEEEFVCLDKKDLEIIDIYYLHFGLITLAFEITHNLDIQKSLENLYGATI